MDKSLQEIVDKFNVFLIALANRDRKTLHTRYIDPENNTQDIDIAHDDPETIRAKAVFISCSARFLMGNYGIDIPYKLRDILIQLDEAGEPMYRTASEYYMFLFYSYRNYPEDAKQMFSVFSSSEHSMEFLKQMLAVTCNSHYTVSKIIKRRIEVDILRHQYVKLLNDVDKTQKVKKNNRSYYETLPDTHAEIREVVKIFKDTRKKLKFYVMDEFRRITFENQHYADLSQFVHNETIELRFLLAEHLELRQDECIAVCFKLLGIDEKTASVLLGISLSGFKRHNRNARSKVDLKTDEKNYDVFLDKLLEYDV